MQGTLIQDGTLGSIFTFHPDRGEDLERVLQEFLGKRYFIQNQPGNQQPLPLARDRRPAGSERQESALRQSITQAIQISQAIHRIKASFTLWVGLPEAQFA
jgi:hypothetical protein